jgi:hypothetical protein
VYGLVRTGGFPEMEINGYKNMSFTAKIGETRKNNRYAVREKCYNGEKIPIREGLWLRHREIALIRDLLSYFHCWTVRTLLFSSLLR